MLPAYRPDQIVIAIRKRPRPGDVVVVMHREVEKIKRVHELQDGRLFVLGDNAAESTDSRSFGWLSPDTLRGVVVWPRR